MSVHLHIEHLVLEGLPVDAGEGEVVQAALQAELTLLMANGELALGLRAGGARAEVGSEEIQLTGDDTPTTLGRQIGRAVYGGISR